MSASWQIPLKRNFDRLEILPQAQVNLILYFAEDGEYFLEVDRERYKAAGLV
jgi:hypothetical protein